MQLCYQDEIAVNLTYPGKYSEALTILKRLQKENPEDHSIAASPGTVHGSSLAVQYWPWLEVDFFYPDVPKNRPHN
jgi:hypothetical protein